MIGYDEIEENKIKISTGKPKEIDKEGKQDFLKDLEQIKKEVEENKFRGVLVTHNIENKQSMFYALHLTPIEYMKSVIRINKIIERNVKELDERLDK